MSAGRRLPTSELQLRVASAIVLIAVTLLLTWIGGVWFRFLCALIAAAVFYEWLHIAKERSTPSERGLTALLMVVVSIVIVTGPGTGVGFATIFALTAIAIMSAPLLQSSRWNAAGLAYAGATMLALALLRGSDIEGLKTVIFLFVVVWSTDIMAYFVGRFIGGPKLAPAISPGKTWSGALGGTGSAVLLGMVVALAMETTLSAAALFALIVVLSAASQMGDLFESWLKRRFQVKDSGHLIPGHGGVMDRVDGLVAASLLLFVIGAVFAVPDRPALAFF